MTARALRMLYREIPAVVGCEKGCGRCCGPVAWSPEERRRIAGREPPGTIEAPAPGRNGFVMLASSENPRRCAMLDDEKRCTAYDVRPMMCRLFAAADAPLLTCPFGARAKRPLTDTKARALCRQYQAGAGQ